MSELNYAINKLSKESNISGIELKEKFTKEFFDEFQFDAEFRSIFMSIEKGLTPYNAIEHLCKSKKELIKALKDALENVPRKIIVTSKRLEQLLDEI